MSASANDPEALARAAEDEWEKRHPNRVGLLPEDLEWEEAEEEQ